MGSVSRPPCIEPKARKEEYFGLETEPMSTRPSQLKFQLSAPQAVLLHSRKKLPVTGRLCCCPALSSEPGLILLTTQVVRGSDGLGFVLLVVHPQVVTSVWGV